MEENQFSGEQNEQEAEEGNEALTRVTGMYKDWFLDYASYVILERAVPAIEDGFKPVQRRIMHSLKEMDDGRYNKVANVVGNTMQYHPHGDASIADAMVQLGQKDLLIDTQGNWGNILTGDGAAAPRYIEARLSKFGLDVVFSPKITEWQLSYDGRKKEPVNLPVKFPLLLAQGAEGIAVGLSTKILPHNFNELIDASIKHLQGKRFKIYPDFPTGGIIDVANYNEGLRGGKVRVRARINQQSKSTLVISEIPYGTNTSSLIDSILKANDKGKIKIKKIEDNTAAEVEILVHLPNNISPDKTIDALYAFTSCETSISPLGCVIEDNKPHFIGVHEMLRRSTDNTVELLKQELEIQLNELEEQWHFASLERIFIENRIYRDIEEEEQDMYNPSYFRSNASSLMKLSTWGEGSLMRFLSTVDYQHELKNITYFNGQTVYAITFRPRKARAKYSGNLFVSAADFAVLKADYRYARGKRGQKVNLKLVLGIKYIENQSSGTVVYHQMEDGKYTPYYIQRDYGQYIYLHRGLKLIENGNKKRKVRLDFLLEGANRNREEILITGYQPLDATSFPEESKEKIQVERLQQFESGIWQDQQIIAPLEEMKNFKATD
jgi:hypothetical protein